MDAAIPTVRLLGGAIVSPPLEEGADFQHGGLGDLHQKYLSARCNALFIAKLAIKLLQILHSTIIHGCDAFLDSLTLAILPFKGVKRFATVDGQRLRKSVQPSSRRKIFSTTMPRGGSINAATLICPPHFGQDKGSTSYIATSQQGPFLVAGRQVWAYPIL